MRSRFFMIVSLVVLGIGLIGILYIKASSVPDTPAPSSLLAAVETPETRYVIWTAKHDILVGDAVSREDLRIEKILEADAFELGIKQDIDITFVEGMVAKTNIPKFSPVMPENIVTPNQDGYFNLVIDSGYVPVPLSVSKKLLLGGLIESGSIVDLLVMTSSTQNLVNGPQIRDLSSVSIAPLFIGIKVLQVKKPKVQSNIQDNIKKSAESVPEPQDVTLILQLTRKQVAKLTIAQNIAQVEVHLSNGETSAFELSADSGDILSDYKSVRELRARSETVQ